MRNKKPVRYILVLGKKKLLKNIQSMTLAVTEDVVVETLRPRALPDAALVVGRRGVHGRLRNER